MARSQELQLGGKGAKYFLFEFLDVVKGGYRVKVGFMGDATPHPH